jgi:hypothetical protein
MPRRSHRRTAAIVVSASTKKLQKRFKSVLKNVLFSLVFFIGAAVKRRERSTVNSMQPNLWSGAHINN